MKLLLSVLCFTLTISVWCEPNDRGVDAKEPAAPIVKVGPPTVKILQIVQGAPRRRMYPYGVTTLLKHVGEKTSIHVDTEPDFAESFEDERIFDYPMIYVNFADREEWSFSDLEKKNLRDYISRGGFIHIDAGINASFLRGNRMAGQYHSFAEWEASPEVKKAFKDIFPGKTFKPLKRTHGIFRSFYKGLPETKKLPDTVREFVIKEKWPQGTYSFVAMKSKGRIAVLCTPIIAMGWGRNHLGNWVTTIGFRIREGAERLDERLKTAAYSGPRYETRREDGDKDVVFCQSERSMDMMGAGIEAKPAWVQEPKNKWRVFRYYHSREISEFAHEFYTQLGTNIIVYTMTH